MFRIWCFWNKIGLIPALPGIQFHFWSVIGNIHQHAVEFFKIEKFNVQALIKSFSFHGFLLLGINNTFKRLSYIFIFENIQIFKTCLFHIHFRKFECDRFIHSLDIAKFARHTMKVSIAITEKIIAEITRPSSSESFF